MKKDPAKKGERSREYVQIMAVDTEPGSVTLPTDYPEATRQALAQPYTIAIDRTAVSRLGVKPGDIASLNGKEVRVGALLDGYPNMMQPTVVMSRATLRLLGMASVGSQVGPLYARLRDPGQADLVRDQLNAKAHGMYRAWTKPELAAANDASMLKNQFIGIMLGFSAVLGLLIGVAITSQTLRGAILANIKEFASLRRSASPWVPCGDRAGAELLVGVAGWARPPSCAPASSFWPPAAACRWSFQRAT